MQLKQEQLTLVITLLKYDLKSVTAPVLTLEKNQTVIFRGNFNENIFKYYYKCKVSIIKMIKGMAYQQENVRLLAYTDVVETILRRDKNKTAPVRYANKVTEVKLEKAGAYINKNNPKGINLKD